MAIIGFSMAACDDDSGSGSGGGGGGSGGGDSGGGSGSGGMITIAGIPSEFNGMYAFCSADTSPSSTIYGFQSGDYYQITACKISNGSVSIPAWVGFTGKRYSGNATIPSYSYLAVYIMNKQNFDMVMDGFINYRIRIRFKNNVTFSNGSVTLSWNNGTVE